jgi:hypothetical protein
MTKEGWELCEGYRVWKMANRWLVTLVKASPEGYNLGRAKILKINLKIELKTWCY